jgi:hypothetical protein
VKLCVLLALTSTAYADISIRALGASEPAPRVYVVNTTIVVPQEEDDEEPIDRDATVRALCAPLLKSATSTLRKTGAIEISPIDGRSLVANYFLDGRRKNASSVNVEVRVDCLRKLRDDRAWQASDSYFERQKGRLQVSFIIPRGSRALAFLPQMQASLDRVILSQ